MCVTILDSMYNVIVLLYAICKSLWHVDDKNLIRIEDEKNYYGNKLCNAYYEYLCVFMAWYFDRVAISIEYLCTTFDSFISYYSFGPIG